MYLLSDSHVAPTSQFLTPVKMLLLVAELPVKWQGFWWNLIHSVFHENECICLWKIGTRNGMKLYFVGNYKFDFEFKYFP